MARRADDSEHMSSERNLPALGKSQLTGRKSAIQLHPQHLCSCLIRIVHEYGIVFSNLRQKTESRVDSRVAKVMIKMTVCAEVVDRVQSVFLYIGNNRSLFIFREGTTVNDDTFLGIVTDDVAVFLEGVDLECFDFKHKRL